jgi:hypothetical protein
MLSILILGLSLAPSRAPSLDGRLIGVALSRSRMGF